MSKRPTVTPVEQVSPDAHVRHFDELDESAQSFLADGGEAGTVPEDLDDGDVVVFTDYYRVRVS